MRKKKYFFKKFNKEQESKLDKKMNVFFGIAFALILGISIFIRYVSSWYVNIVFYLGALFLVLTVTEICFIFSITSKSYVKVKNKVYFSDMKEGAVFYSVWEHDSINALKFKCILSSLLITISLGGLCVGLLVGIMYYLLTSIIIVGASGLVILIVWLYFRSNRVMVDKVIEIK